MDFHILIIAGVMILLDIIFGFAGAVKNHGVESGKLREGLWHKAGFIGLIALAYIVQDAATYVDLSFDVPTVLAVCIYIIVTEAVSVFENLCVLNPQLVGSPLGSVFKNDEKVEAAEEDVAGKHAKDGDE